MTTIPMTRTFTHLPNVNAPETSPGGYTITHRYQYQDDEYTNAGQYEESVEVEYWEGIPDVVEAMLNYPDSGGFTLSITILANDIAHETQEERPRCSN
jgi:hypothetical protein